VEVVEAVGIGVSAVAGTALDLDPMISFSDVWAHVETVAQTAVVGGAPVVAVATAAAAAVLHSSWLSFHHPADQKKVSLW
jgi:hypothetical protein